MKRIGYTSAALGLAIVLASGSGYAQAPGSSGSAQPPSGQTQSTPQNQQTKPLDTREFINQATIASLAEIQLGKMAADKGMINDVKGFGQRMVNDHTKANQELAAIAKQLGVTPPTEIDQKHKELYDRLSKLQGREFDREYMNAMVQGHQEVLTMLRARVNQRTSNDSPDPGQQNAARPAAGGPQQPAAGSSAQPRSSAAASAEQALSQWAQKTIPVVEEHLELARKIQSDLNRQ